MNTEFNLNELKAVDRLPSPSGTVLAIMQLAQQNDATVQQVSQLVVFSFPHVALSTSSPRSHAPRGNAVRARCAAGFPDPHELCKNLSAPRCTAECHEAQRASTAFPRSALVFIHKSVQDRHFGKVAVMTGSDVGRNKPARRQQGWAFPASEAPETLVLRLTRGQAYSGLLRDVYNDERSAWERGKKQ
ncbi:MAG: hypothetical protein Q7U66_04940 [Methylobacter sp.]|nr:hypothetical protein [Methylobacter sp.]